MVRSCHFPVGFTAGLPAGAEDVEDEEGEVSYQCSHGSKFAEDALGGDKDDMGGVSVTKVLKISKHSSCCSNPSTHVHLWQPLQRAYVYTTCIIRASTLLQHRTL